MRLCVHWSLGLRGVFPLTLRSQVKWQPWKNTLCVYLFSKVKSLVILAFLQSCSCSDTAELCWVQLFSDTFVVLLVTC